jgi:hypothetical protein
VPASGTARSFSVSNSGISAQINSGGGIGNTILSDVIDPSVIGISCAHTTTGTTPCLTAASFSTSAGQRDFGSNPNLFRGAGYFDIDTQLMKNFSVKEKVHFGVGAQFYNVLNHPNFANASGRVTSSGLGLISATVVPPTSIYGPFQSGTVSGRVVVMQGRITF